MGSGKASILLVINSQKTILLLHKIVNLAVEWRHKSYARPKESVIPSQNVLVCITEKHRFEMSTENK